MTRLLHRIESQTLVVVCVLLGSLWAVFKLGSDVREGETASVDRAILLWFRTPGDLALPIGPAWLHESARDITALGGFTVLTLVTIGATLALLAAGRRRQALVFAATVILAQLASGVLKSLNGRPRPALVPHLDAVMSSSFPSGHAMMSPAVYFTLIAILAAGSFGRSLRFLMIASAVLLVIAIGVSRVYLGVHWPTDVLAGWTLGSAIALAAWRVLALLRPPAPLPTGPLPTAHG